jgi:hypothetical protein
MEFINSSQRSNRVEVLSYYVREVGFIEEDVKELKLD